MITVVMTGLLAACFSASGMDVAFQMEKDRLEILTGGQPFAVYVYNDEEILRPYFCNVKAPNGVQVTRMHPPDPNIDKNNDDHATYHPGLWLAFGDLGGVDFWRLRARVRHVRFEYVPGDTPGVFTVFNAYETLDTPPRLLCEETCTYTVTADSTTRWIRMESQFRALAPDIAFGDQEEMGFGVRIATPLTVKHGNGTIINSLGGIDEKGTWGRAADWCAYSGVQDGQRTGILLMASPDNFRKCWFHNRNYGLMVANPFGRKSMTGPKDDAVPLDATPLTQGTPFNVGFAVCIFALDTDVHPAYDALYGQYVTLSKEKE